MHKLILATFICLSGISTQQELKAAQRAPISNDTLIAAGISAAGAGLLYLAYKLNYKNTLADAHAALADCNKQLLEISRHGNNYFQVEQPHFWPTDIHHAYNLETQIKGDIAHLQDIRTTIERHQCEWKGYKDFNHAEAEMFIFDAKIMEKNLQQTLTMLQQTIIVPLELQVCFVQTSSDYGDILYASPTPLLEEMTFRYRNAHEPLLAAVSALENVVQDLINKACKVPQENPYKTESIALSSQLKKLIKTLVNLAEYKEQLEKKRINDTVQEELAEKRRIAQAHLEAQQRAAWAAEATAYAAAQQAQAERDRADAEQKNAQINQERLLLELARPQNNTPEVNVTIHNN